MAWLRFTRPLRLDFKILGQSLIERSLKFYLFLYQNLPGIYLSAEQVTVNASEIFHHLKRRDITNY